MAVPPVLDSARTPSVLLIIDENRAKCQHAICIINLPHDCWPASKFRVSQSVTEAAWLPDHCGVFHGATGCWIDKDTFPIEATGLEMFSQSMIVYLGCQMRGTYDFLLFCHFLNDRSFAWECFLQRFSVHGVTKEPIRDSIHKHKDSSKQYIR